jgi:ABC-type amino acid transport system permease subunit
MDNFKESILQTLDLIESGIQVSEQKHKMRKIDKFIFWLSASIFYFALTLSIVLIVKFIF